MNTNEEEQIRVYSCALVVRFDSRKGRAHEGDPADAARARREFSLDSRRQCFKARPR